MCEIALDGDQKKGDWTPEGTAATDAEAMNEKGGGRVLWEVN